MNRSNEALKCKRRIDRIGQNEVLGSFPPIFIAVVVGFDVQHPVLYGLDIDSHPIEGNRAKRFGPHWVVLEWYQCVFIVIAGLPDLDVAERTEYGPMKFAEKIVPDLTSRPLDNLYWAVSRPGVSSCWVEVLPTVQIRLELIHVCALRRHLLLFVGSQHCCC